MQIAANWQMVLWLLHQVQLVLNSPWIQLRLMRRIPSQKAPPYFISLDAGELHDESPNFTLKPYLCAPFRDSLGGCTVVGDLRWTGAYGVQADVVARTHCSVEIIKTEDISVGLPTQFLLVQCCVATANFVLEAFYNVLFCVLCIF